MFLMLLFPVLSSFFVLLYPISQQPYMAGSIVITILKKKRLSFRVVEELDHPGHTICLAHAVEFFIGNSVP